MGWPEGVASRSQRNKTARWAAIEVVAARCFLRLDGFQLPLAALEWARMKVALLEISPRLAPANRPRVRSTFQRVRALEARRARVIELAWVAVRSKGAAFGRAKLTRQTGVARGPMAVPRRALARAQEPGEQTSGAPGRVAAGRAGSKRVERASDETERADEPQRIGTMLVERPLVEPQPDGLQARDWAKEPKRWRACWNRRSMRRAKSRASGSQFPTRST